MVFLTCVLAAAAVCFTSLPLVAQQSEDKAANETSQPTDTETHRVFDVRGWSVNYHRQLFHQDETLSKGVLHLLEEQLRRVEQAIPEAAVKHLKPVKIWVNPPYDGIRPTAEYHPNQRWLQDNDRDPAMAKCIELTNADNLSAEVVRMPYLMLHELAHAYHDQVLGFRDTRIRQAFDTAKDSNVYDEVDRFTGKKMITDRAYAITNHKEYFAESTEAFFGKNDFFPFDRDQLKKADPVMFSLLPELWQQRPSQQ